MFFFDYVDCYCRVCIGESFCERLLPFFRRVSPSVFRKYGYLFILLYTIVFFLVSFLYSKIWEYFFFNLILIFESVFFLVLVLISLSFAINQLFCFYSSWIYSKIDYDYFFQFLFRFSLSTDNVRTHSDTVYYIVSRWLRENCSIPIVDILYKVRNAKCSLVTLQIDGMWFNGEYRRKTGVSMRVSPFVFIPMKA